MKIHPLAVVDPRARLGRGVEVGPFAIIEPLVVVGDNCKLESRVVLKRGTVLGDNNYVGEGAVLGGLPQHLDIPEIPGTTVIGSGNTIRENVTVHRALREGTATVIGDNNMLMVNTHVAHDCRMGNHIIMANNAMLAGHVTVGDRAVLSGAVAVHQFCRIGTLAMVGGQAHIVQDVPPYLLVDGLSSEIVGLNRVGLKRAGFGADKIKQLKAAYRLIYRSGLTWNEILARLEADFEEGPVQTMAQFLSTTTRGIIHDRRPSPASSLRLCGSEEDEDEGDGPRLRVHAG